jgi:Glutathione synthase/Ribosomal protein S6 modification enzyme (glutaminyl transferase)
MMEYQLIGITRSNQFSPNHIGNDAAIFQQTVRELGKAGCRTIVCRKRIPRADFPMPYIFNMARNKITIERLFQLEKSGSLVVNSPVGIDNCTREKMTRLLLASQIPHPDSWIVPTDKPLSEELLNQIVFPCWIKRGDFHAIHREDVSFVRHREEADCILSEYALRNIPIAVINEHLKGDLIKFYGVADTDFFYWFYPFEHQHSKFGLETINGASQGFPFSIDRLREICSQAAHILHVSVYGGDCVVGSDGSMRLIDFNDWPSFAPCRNQAAPYIAQTILEKISLHRIRVLNNALIIK